MQINEATYKCYRNTRFPAKVRVIDIRQVNFHSFRGNGFYMTFTACDGCAE